MKKIIKWVAIVVGGLFALTILGTVVTAVVSPESLEPVEEAESEPTEETEPSDEPAPEETEEPEPTKEPEPKPTEEPEPTDEPDEAMFWLSLDDNWGHDYMTFDRDRTIELGYDACETIAELDEVTEDTLTRSSMEFSNKSGQSALAFEETNAIYAGAMSHLCPEQGDRL